MSSHHFTAMLSFMAPVHARNSSTQAHQAYSTMQECVARRLEKQEQKSHTQARTQEYIQTHERVHLHAGIHTHTCTRSRARASKARSIKLKLAVNL